MSELLKPSEVLLDYTAFEKLIKERELHPDDKEWVAYWRGIDLALSPMDDDKRRHMRYGFQMGWNARIPDTPAPAGEGQPDNMR